MKRITSLALVVFLVISAVSFVLAEETTIDEATQKEVKVMDYPLGAEIRLLQLEKSISKNIAKGEAVIEAFETIGEDTSELQFILNELKTIKEEVQALDSESETAVQDFVDLKKDARDTIKNFRDTANEIKSSLDDETLQALRESFREINEDKEFTEIKERIRNKIRQHNTERIRAIFGENAEQLKEQVQNGELNKEQIRKRVREIISQMTQEEKQGIFNEVREKNLINENTAKNILEKVKENFNERMTERNTNRRENQKGDS